MTSGVRRRPSARADSLMSKSQSFEHARALDGRGGAGARPTGRGRWASEAPARAAGFGVQRLLRLRAASAAARRAAPACSTRSAFDVVQLRRRLASAIPSAAGPALRSTFCRPSRSIVAVFWNSPSEAARELEEGLVVLPQRLGRQRGERIAQLGFGVLKQRELFGRRSGARPRARPRARPSPARAASCAPRARARPTRQPPQRRCPSAQRQQRHDDRYPRWTKFRRKVADCRNHRFE